MRNAASIAASLLAAAALAGCSTFRPAQKDAFVDGDGNVMIAEYGSLSKPYTYMIVSPMNGVALECKDRRIVRVTLPSADGTPTGERLTFRICQNDSPKGTMYETKDKKWKYLTIGLKTRLYLWSADDKDYLLVFEGTTAPSILDEMEGRQ